MRFTKEEFETMASQLLDQTPISYDMLVKIAEKTLRGTVEKWCNTDSRLKEKGYEDDIMQEVHLRLIKTVIPYFLRRGGVTGAYNNDPEGFEDWMFRVAENIKKDVANSVGNDEKKRADVDESVFENLPDGKDPYAGPDTEHLEALTRAFNIVLSSGSGVHKILTWLGHSLLMLENDVTKIETNNLLLTACEGKTLNDMYDMILAASAGIPWLVITQAQDTKIRTALRKKRSGTVTYGETQFSAFFMKSKGKASGKKSISDWMNRMNDLIRREMGSEEPMPASERKIHPRRKPGMKIPGG